MVMTIVTLKLFCVHDDEDNHDDDDRGPPLLSVIYVISGKLQKLGQFLSRALPTYYDADDDDRDQSCLLYTSLRCLHLFIEAYCINARYEWSY